MDYVQWYTKISAPFRGTKGKGLISLLNSCITGAFVGEYVAALFMAARSVYFDAVGLQAQACSALSCTSPLKVLLVPLVTFAVVSVLRAVLNKPRPYEVYDIEPLFAPEEIAKRESGKSFPSRHVASAVIIAFTLAIIYPTPLAISVQVLLCVGIAFCRVVGGVHFPRDVISAAVLALAFGIVGYLVIPS